MPPLMITFYRNYTKLNPHWHIKHLGRLLHEPRSVQSNHNAMRFSQFRDFYGVTGLVESLCINTNFHTGYSI